jgi:hypothetical protein
MARCHVIRTTATFSAVEKPFLSSFQRATIETEVREILPLTKGHDTEVYYTGQ